MKKLGILLFACITALNLWAEEKFKIGKLTFKIETPTTVGLTDADEDITKVFLIETIDYNGNSYTLTHIGKEAFMGCDSLTSVTIPNSVTSIGERAFEGCKSLKSVTIPNSVTSIGGWAFAWCESLTSVTIPNSVTSIGEGAFYECSSLTSVTIPNSVTSIGTVAFEGCSSLTSVTIPSSVTRIEGGAFWGTALYENPANWENGALYIDNCLIEVDDGFAGHFRIKENTRVIAGWAFEYCDSLTSVTIPNSVTSIGELAFSHCTGLTSVTIPNSVTEIGGAVFCGCENLTSVVLSKNMTSLPSFEGPEDSYGFFENCSSLTSITIPNGVTRIGDEAFRGTALYENPANWENGALYIDDCLIEVAGGFAGDFRIKENTRVIAGWAFEYCSSLTSVTIPNSVTSIGGWAFAWCESLTSVTIPNSVTSIGEGAFEGCSSLTSVTIPNSVTSIGFAAFMDCSSLTSISIPNSVTETGGAVFYGCENLTSVVLSKNMTSLPSYEDLYGTYGFFENCSSLTSITIPESVEYIGDYAFAGCSSLTSVNIPNYKEFGDGAFPEHTKVINEAQKFTIGKLTYKTISSNEVKIVEADKSITSADISPTITYQGVTYSVTSIEDLAFYNCRSLTFITIPEGVTRIGNMAFEGCSSLKSAIIPSSAEIGGGAFPFHTSIVKVTQDIRVGLLTYKKISSSEVKLVKADKRIINAHLSSTINYKGVTYSVTSIGDTAFYECSYLTSITIPNSVTSIGEGAFAGCVNLPSITIPNSVTSIGDGAFAGCFSLTSITIPNSVTSIGTVAFYECSSLTSVTIPNSVTSIGDYAFYGCYSLNSISIPSSVTHIGEFALPTQGPHLNITGISIPITY